MRSVAMLLLVAAGAAGQVFEVASIKLGDPHATQWSTGESQAGFNSKDAPIRDLVLYAYDAKEYQLAGAPKWVESVPYTILAKLEPLPKAPPHGDENDPRIMAAVRALLKDRFHMEIHRERKDVAGYALVPGKNAFRPKKLEGSGDSGWTIGGGKATFRRTSMPYLAEALSHILHRPVIDQTGIAGEYALTLEWSVDSDTAEAGTSIFGALQDLGLKLEARKVPVDLIVIDHIEKPTEN